jgi:hypothetical protein
MRLFWITVLGSFLWVSTHEVAAHAGICTDPAGSGNECCDAQAIELSRSGGSAGTDADHHGCDSHGHFRGAVNIPVRSIIKTPLMLAAPVVFDSIGVHPPEHPLLSMRRVFRPCAQQDLPRYLSARCLLV